MSYAAQPWPPLVAAIATWRDGPLLAEAVASAAPHVDRIIIMDGGYLGFIEEEDRWTPTADLLAAVTAGAGKVDLYPVKRRDAGYPGRPEELFPGLWALQTEAAKRGAMLDLARSQYPVELEAGWLLTLDADELLRNGELLRGELRAYDAIVAPAFPLPRVEPSRAVWLAPTRLMRLEADYLGAAHLVQWQGGTWRLDHTEATPAMGDRLTHRAHVLHRWNLREPWRAEIREAWERELVLREAEAVAAYADAEYVV